MLSGVALVSSRPLPGDVIAILPESGRATRLAPSINWRRGSGRSRDWVLMSAPYVLRLRVRGPARTAKSVDIVARDRRPGINRSGIGAEPVEIAMRPACVADQMDCMPWQKRGRAGDWINALRSDQIPLKSAVISPISAELLRDQRPEGPPQFPSGPAARQACRQTGLINPAAQIREALLAKAARDRGYWRAGYFPPATSKAAF